MEDRLIRCREMLREVETKLLELQQSPAKDVEEQASRLGEALSFVHEAIRAISRTPEPVEVLQDAVKHSAKSADGRKYKAGAA
jgi:hypothetical protein